MKLPKDFLPSIEKVNDALTRNQRERFILRKLQQILLQVRDQNLFTSDVFGEPEADPPGREAR